MGFMEQQIVGPCDWWEADTREGIFFIPQSDFSKDFVIEQYDIDESDVTTRHGFGARMSAPGYMDCTEWCVFDTEREAEAYLAEYYEDDEENSTDEA
jgi:hypothetical protein